MTQVGSAAGAGTCILRTRSSWGLFSKYIYGDLRSQLLLGYSELQFSIDQ